MPFDANINAYFIITIRTAKTKADDRAIYQFKKALTNLQNHIPKEKIRHIESWNGFNLIVFQSLSSKDVFIFDRFEGKFFQQLQHTKCRIVGAPCLLECLVDSEALPEGKGPVYTCAMRHLQISAAGIESATKKTHVSRLIQWMDDQYVENVGRSLTHFISNPYELAIPVMHEGWVQHVWERSCVQQVKATDIEFSQYKLPIFFRTNVTCIGVDDDKKYYAADLVNANRRVFSSQFVDIVIMENNHKNLEEYAEKTIRF